MIEAWPFIFQMEQIINPEEMKRIREEILRQMEEGVVLLPNYVKLVYHPGMSELAEVAKDHERLC